MPDWYEQNIELGIRDIVRLLRDNGVNTTYSCHHAMVIEAENSDDAELTYIYNLLIENGYDNFKIELCLYKEKDKHLRRYISIQFFRCPICNDNTES